MNTNPANARSIFISAVENYAADQWGEYLDDACGDNQSLRRRVEQLLHAHQGEDSFLDRGDPDDAVRPTLSQPITEQPGTIIGPYKLLQQIGEGGMGVVYMAEQIEPVERRVALKIIKPGMETKEVIARFEAERQALALMDHPNIARVLDAGTTDFGHPYFVMELVKGVPVTQYADEQHLTPRERLQLFLPVCQAVQHAHQKGIIHRDLKPSNILVAQFDEEAVPKVIDFGVAKAISQKLTEKSMFTQYGQIVGTVEYMSPEQARFNQLDIDTRSDIYSLGVLLYELLTGTTPFDRSALKRAGYDEIQRILQEEEPLRPSLRISTLNADLKSTVCDRRRVDARKLGKSLRGDLDWIIMKTLEKNRDRRYETANLLGEDLRCYLQNEPVMARRPSVVIRVHKWLLRHTALAAIAAFIFVAGIAGGVAAGVSRHYELRELQESAQRVLEEAEIDLETRNFGRAQSRLQVTLTAVRGEPSVCQEYEAPLRDALARAETLLRIQQFEHLADEIRFDARRVAELPLTEGWTAEERHEASQRPIELCNKALELINVNADRSQLDGLERGEMPSAEFARLRALVGEVLFFKARLLKWTPKTGQPNKVGFGPEWPGSGGPEDEQEASHIGAGPEGQGGPGGRSW